jgi:hypothetical protein
MENQESKSPALKTVKAIAASPVYAMFDIVKVDGKDVVTGSIGFVDQFGMERLARTAGERGVLNLGKHVLAIFNGHIDILEPDDATKAKLAEQMQASIAEAKEKVMGAYEEPKAPEAVVEPPSHVDGGVK